MRQLRKANFLTISLLPRLRCRENRLKITWIVFRRSARYIL
ncbi:hypothetical protein Y888_02330 [Mixta calida B021323]|nr:hypothetical protein Y888_02330 [Mixta calida B021323]